MIVVHDAVLQKEAVDALVTRPDGYYVDGTFGYGGHSQEILKRLNTQGRLLAIDKDPQAITVGRQLCQQDHRFAIAHGSFAELTSILANKRWKRIDGILLDLGVSSPQLDQAGRGFSFLRNGPLDMRMDPQRGPSAAQWLATARQEEIAAILKKYGQERYAKRIAKAITRARSEAPIETTGRLADVVAKAHPAWSREKHPATKTFQAIRLLINRELEDLSTVLDQVLAVLAIGGRLVVISFHSLEDRLVKRFISQHVRGDVFPKTVPVTCAQLNRQLKPIGGACRASEEEVKYNRRSRSAIMRVAERIGMGD